MTAVKKSWWKANRTVILVAAGCIAGNMILNSLPAFLWLPTHIFGFGYDETKRMPFNRDLWIHARVEPCVQGPRDQMQHDLEHHYAVKTSHSSIENDLGSPDRKGQREELAAFCTGRSWTIPDNADSFGMYTIYKDRDELSTYQVFIYDKQSHFIKSVIYTVL